MLCSTSTSNLLLSSRSVFPCIPFHSTPFPLHPFPVSLVQHPSYPFLCPPIFSHFPIAKLTTFAHFYIPTFTHSSIPTEIPHPYIRSTILFIYSHIYINSSSSLYIPLFPHSYIPPNPLYSPSPYILPTFVLLIRLSLQSLILSSPNFLILPPHPYIPLFPQLFNTFLFFTNT